MFSQDSIAQVAAANDIVEIIGRHVTLKRAGSRYTALCPFHREKTPSFYVDPSWQRYKCFGCGVGGSVFKFVMAMENLDFPSSVRRLAERAGITVVEEGGNRRDEAAGFGEMKRRLKSLHSEAADWFHRNLKKSPDAAKARDYLTKRGLSAEVAARWRIGYAPDSWDRLSSWAHERGYTPQEILLGGLTKAKDDESARGGENVRAYDRFRDRLMFPICNELGEVIAFSGRVLDPDAKAAKYLNSPETPLFTKGKVLFGLHMTRRAMLDAGYAIVCEGQIDLITAFEAGVANVIAPQGTAFTEKQAHVLSRQVSEVVLCFDSDAAGQKAAERSIVPLLACNLSVRVATMPPGEDPDSLIRRGGAEAFRERIAAAQDFFDFQIERLGGEFDLGTARGKTQFARRIAESVALLTDAVLREAVIAKVTARLGISPETFRPLLKARRPAFAREDAPDLTGGPSADEGPFREETQPFEKPPTTLTHLLRLALENPETRQWMLEQPWDEQLPHTPGADLLMRVLGADLAPEDPASVNAFLSTLSPAEESFLSTLLLDKPFPQPMKLAADCWLALERAHLLERRAALASRMRLPGLSEEETTQLQKEVLDLQKRLTDIARL